MVTLAGLVGHNGNGHRNDNTIRDSVIPTKNVIDEIAVCPTIPVCQGVNVDKAEGGNCSTQNG